EGIEYTLWPGKACFNRTPACQLDVFGSDWHRSGVVAWVDLTLCVDGPHVDYCAVERVHAFGNRHMVEAFTVFIVEALRVLQRVYETGFEVRHVGEPWFALAWRPSNASRCCWLVSICVLTLEIAESIPFSMIASER